MRRMHGHDRPRPEGKRQQPEGRESDHHMRVRIHPPADCDRGPRGVEAMLDALHASNPQRRPLTLEIATHNGEIAFFANIPPELKVTFVEELQDAYPGIRLEFDQEPLADDMLERSVCLILTPDVLAIRCFQEFDDQRERTRHDPLTGILSQVRGGGSMRISVSLTLKPAAAKRTQRAAVSVQNLARSFPLDALRRWHYEICTSPLRRDRITASVLRLVSRRRKATPASGKTKLDRHLFEATIRLSVRGTNHLASRLDERLAEVIGAFGRFTSANAWFRPIPIGSRVDRLPNSLFYAAELATLWHIPFSTTEVSKLARSGVREPEPPTTLPSKQLDGFDVTELGRVKYRGERRRFGIRVDDLRRHMFICGRTGTGKSTLIRAMVGDAMHSGKSVCVIDPHGDLIDAILDDVPRHRTNDVIHFSAAERNSPVAFNPLHCESVEQRPLVADSIVVSLKKMYGDSWGPRLEMILRNSVLALLEQPDTTLLSVQKLLTSKVWRTSFVARVSDPVIRGFWTDIFGKWNDRFREEAVSPVLNKLDAFLASPIARAITCRPKSTIRIRSILDNPRSIFLCNLSKGLIGEQTSNVLGALLVAAIQNAALSRADVPEAKRCDMQIHIDEFHSFVAAGNSSFSTILSEGRKYRVSFVLATQFLEQIDDGTLAAVFGNCGSTISFRSGIRDAENLAAHLGGGVSPDDICNLPNFTAYAKLLNRGEPTRSPFLMTTIPAPSSPAGRREIVERVSRQKYGSRVTEAVSPLR